MGKIIICLSVTVKYRYCW